MLRPAALALALVATACSTPVGGVSAPSGTGQIPSTPLDLGNWRASSEGATLSTFRRGVSARYAPGAAINTVTADLRRSRFNCGPASPALEDNRGVPPVQVCRRIIRAAGCTHTWQVHLFDRMGDRRLASTRGLYDRGCGDDGLLGGPG